jgi:ribosome biogenesis GTPase A
MESKKKLAGGITVARSKGRSSGYCYGCGADLVKGEAGSMGTVTKSKSYWAEKSNELKKAKIKNWALCPRCRRLRKMEEEGVVTNADILGPDSKMTEIFREEVSKIRSKPNAVVILCLDAVNVNGSLLRSIRNYVGGNPILLAVTRCDLLPDYVWESNSPEELKKVYRERAAEIMPAEVYLCSEAKGLMREIGGIKELAMDLWDHLNGRDPYVIGVANIGKSTLTDILISGFINKGEQNRHFNDRLGRKRVEKLREARITKSALPGTTLQNVRVPCFEDHNQALWDTPGLLVDSSLKQFPIRNFRHIRAQRPTQIVPQIHVINDRKSLALLLTEAGDDKPLMRFEIRLKKNAQGEGPIRVVWNSFLPLQTKIADIDEEKEAEQKRLEAQEAFERQKKIEMEKEAMERESSEEWQKLKITNDMSEEEKAQRKALRRQFWLDKVRLEKKELGTAEWHRREKEKLAKLEDEQRNKELAKLEEIHQVIVERNHGVDIAIANFGWLGVLMPRTTMIKIFAPKTGIRVNNYDALALPSDWGDYDRQLSTDGKDVKKKMATANSPAISKSDSDSETENDDFDLGEYGEYADFRSMDTGFPEGLDGMDVEGDSGEEFDFDDGGDEYGDEEDDSSFFGSNNYRRGGRGGRGGRDRGDRHGRGGDRGRGGGRGDRRDSRRDFYADERRSQGLVASESYRAYKENDASLHVDKDDHWAAYSGVAVGWQYDQDVRYTQGTLESGWNPVRPNSDTFQKQKQEKEAQLQTRKAKDRGIDNDLYEEF